MGLSIGIASCLLILIWIQNEVSYDKFHANYDNIYKVMSYGEKYMIEGFDGSPGVLGPVIKDEVPEIINVVRINEIYGGVELKYENHIYSEKKGLFVDSTFFDVFTFPFISGNKESALANPFNIVFTEKMAKKYFGDEDPIGKTVIYQEASFTVSGVLKDPPDNSHLKFDFLVSINLYHAIGGNFYWGMFMTTTFLQMQDNFNIEKINDRLTEIAVNNNCPQVVSDGVVFRLHPLSGIHLDNLHAKNHYYTDIGNKKVVYIFSAIALIILIIACINYINLSTARSEKRSMEVGIRKVSGAKKHQLINQFLGESFLVSFIALDLAILLAEIFLPLFNNLTQKTLTLSIFGSSTTILGLIALLILTALLAGGYPAGFLSSYKVLNVLKGKLGSHSGRGLYWIRRFLVIFQFLISIILISTTSIVYKQLNYMKNRDPGFNMENIIQVPLKGNIAEKYDLVKQQLLQNPSISYVSAMDAPWYEGSNRCSGCFSWEGKDPEFQLDLLFPLVNYDLFEMMEIKISEGRLFSKDYETDSNQAFILNEEAVKKMGIKNPVGKKCVLSGINNEPISGEIIGVIKNINYSSLHKEIDPQAFRVLNDPSSFSNSTMLVKYNEGNYNEVISLIRNIWDEINPELDFDPVNLKDSYISLYKTEHNLGNILIYFTILAMFISCLGLFGLASFMAERRTKEIGIRKVNGASIKSIILLLSKDFSKWILLSFIIACPLVWIVMSKWLQSFEYKTDMTWWIFVGSGLISLFVALITVSYQSIKMANSNPAESLRYE